jgi:excinuclease ABC subunit C
MVKPKDIAYLPTSPGCYIYRNKIGEVLYVGKAKNLKKRVSNYFLKHDHDTKTAMLVSQIEDIDIIITPSEVEALLLENNLIKKYYPKYNLDLKDSRKYAYILLHEGELPWIEVARDRLEKGDYYGPFVSGMIRKLITDVIARNFRILTNKPSPKLKKIMDKDQYSKRVDQAKKILSGNVDDLIKELEDKMKESSSKANYEYAITLRNQINALETLKQKQIMEMKHSQDTNIINYKIVADEVYLLVFNIRKGVLEEKQSFNFSFYEDFFNDFMIQYYDSAVLPQEIILPEEIDEALAEYLNEKAKRKVKITIPQKGDKKDLLELVATNINTTFFTGSESVMALKEILSMKKIPKNIECFDISHLGGTNTVASMVSFENGLPNKKNYRKFKIRTASGGDDYAAMKEVIERRYSGSLSRTMKNPDLIVMDGGQIQLNAALTTLKDMKISIPTIALAKKLEEIYIPEKKEPLFIERKSKGLQLLQAMRDEAHRFAVGYQRMLRNKEEIGE